MKQAASQSQDAPQSVYFILFVVTIVPFLLDYEVSLFTGSFWFLHIIPVLWFSYEYGIRGGLYAALMTSVFHGVWEWIEVLEGEEEQLGLYITAYVSLTNLTLAIGVGLLADLLKAKNRQFQRMAYYDVVTGLANRKQFHEHLSQTLTYPVEESPAILFIDLDGFKMVNDSYGHGIGDLLLKQVANRLIRCVGEEDCIARWAGDEFIIMVKETSLEEIQVVADRILRSLEIPFMLEGKEIYISSSIGISLYPEHGKAPDTLIHHADTAMYQAKENGKNQTVVYSSALEERQLKRLEMIQGLRKALDKSELALYYQPKVLVETHQALGVEALLRWKRSGAEMVSPATFIPLAEETGLIVPIGEWVLRTACLQLKTWQQEGYSKLTISVNLSARQFLDPDLVNRIKAVLEETEINPSLLILEITESTAMVNLEETMVKLVKLRELGVGLSLDDFGTGYSSLNYLKNFPIHELKIDQSFIRDVLVNPQDAFIVDAIIGVAKNLHLSIVAEGVETKEHVEFLRNHQCYVAQGYYFSRPLPALEFDSFLKHSVSLKQIS